MFRGTTIGLIMWFWKRKLISNFMI
jgi:hypothetical protein